MKTQSVIILINGVNYKFVFEIIFKENGNPVLHQISSEKIGALAFGK